MKKKITLSLGRCLLLAGTMVFVSSCQDYEPFNDQTLQNKTYNHEFVKQFGEIDSRQNWDLFGQLASRIGPETRATMADEPEATPSTKTKTITLDSHGNYTLLLPEINRGNNDFEHSNLGQVTQRFTTTARNIDLFPVNWITTADDEIGIFWYVDEDDPNDPNIKVIMGQDDRLYYIKTLTVIENAKSLLEIVYEFNNGEVIRKWIGDDRNRIGEQFTNNQGQRVTVSPLTYVYEGYRSNHMGSQNNNGEYTVTEFRDDVTANFFSDAEMSSRGIKSQYLVAHAMHIHVPNNISEYGFYIKNNGNYYPWHNQKDPRYSKWELNTAENIEENGKYKMSYTATFNINNLRPVLDGHGIIPEDDRNQYLCFEDWVQTGDADLNDVVYIADGLDVTNIKDDDNITENAILVCEDLKSYDFDFNDIVLGLTYREEDAKTYEWIDHITYVDGHAIAPHWEVKDASATSEKLTVTPMAAGGAYETTVFVGEINLGEIHTLLKEANTPSDPKKHEIINAGATYDDNRGVQPIGPTDIMSFFEGSWDVGEGKTYPTHLSQIFAQGYIRLECYDGTAKKLISNYQYAEGDAPQMMLLPYYFEWPQEEVHISNAYSGFSDWVEDITKTNWILDTQDKDKITERGDFVIDDPQQHEDDPVLVEGVDLPVKPEKFIYGSGDPSTGGFTFNNAYFIDLTGVGKLVAQDAKADLVVHYNPKASGGYYIDDNHKNTLLTDPGKPDDGGPRTTTYTISAHRLNVAIESGGIWIMNTDDKPFGISKVEILIYGVTDPNLRHDLDVTPLTLLFDQLGSVKPITVTSTTAPAGDIYFSSTDTNVATVDGDGNVSAVGEGHCQIIVTALASGGRTDNVQRVHVTVDRTPTVPLTILSVINDAGNDVVEGGTTYHYICHRELTTSEDLSGWLTNGATITIHYEGYSSPASGSNFFRVLNPSGQVIAGNLNHHDNGADDVTYTISGSNLATCLDSTTGEYKLTLQYSQCGWGWTGKPEITSASLTKIAN